MTECTWVKGRRPARPLAERFWEKVQKSDGCWIWKASVLDSGYGTINLYRGNRKTFYAHRIAWELTHGPIPDGLLVLHKCDVRSCVRPDHLRLGDQKDNAADMVRRGRHRYGAARGQTTKMPERQEGDIRCGWTKRRGGAPIPLAQRFWEKVQKGDDCWLWMGVTLKNGYGTISQLVSYGKRKTVYAHRVSWELENGPITGGLFVLHKCDVRACVRPSHLFLGGHQDNSDDKIRKGRYRRGDSGRGEKNACAKLANYQVRVIMALLGAGKSGRAIAEHYGISDSTVSLIKRGKHYSDVTRPVI